MAKQGTTLYEVAERAGVSIATVSRVARGVDQVAPDTRQRVLEAIEALNYRASHFGRALVNRRHETLGIVTPGLSGPYFADLVQSFAEAALEARMSVLLLGTNLLIEADEQVLGMADRADGLAVFGGTISDDLLRKLTAQRTPLVLIAQPQNAGLPTVRVDNTSGTKALVRHLIDDHGYRRIAFAGWVGANPDGRERWEAFVDAHREAGLEPPAAPIPAAFNASGGAEVLAGLRAMEHRPEALVCGNDEMAISVMGALTQHGIRVPEDIAVTGWDDISIASLVTPALTTVRQPTRDLGSRAAQVLLRQIANEPIETVDNVLPAAPRIRGSCGCRTGPASQAREDGRPGV